MTMQISTSPENAVARRSCIFQRSSGWSPRTTRIVSLRPPSSSAAAIARNSAALKTAEPPWPPIHSAPAIAPPRATQTPGRKKRERVLHVMVEDLLDGSLEETCQLDGER